MPTLRENRFSAHSNISGDVRRIAAVVSGVPCFSPVPTDSLAYTRTRTRAHTHYTHTHTLTHIHT